MSFLQADKEAAEAEELKQELGLGVYDSLRNMVQQWQSSQKSQMTEKLLIKAF